MHMNFKNDERTDNRANNPSPPFFYGSVYWPITQTQFRGVLRKESDFNETFEYANVFSIPNPKPERTISFKKAMERIKERESLYIRSRLGL
jgi:hypothetical protein